MNAYTPPALQSATAHWALSGFCDEHLAREIAQARQDERSDLCALLAERVRRQERADPSLKVVRLEGEARRLDGKVAEQDWTPGETVKVGFMTLEVVEKVGSDYRLWNPKSGKKYLFTPHLGCTSGWEA